MKGADLLAQLIGWGSVWLHNGQLEAEAPTPPIKELRALIEENRDALRAAVLLSNPPAWLRLMLDRYVSGHAYTNKKGASFRVSLENVCANVAAALDMWTLDEKGRRVLDLAVVRPEVAEVAWSWKPPKEMEVLVYD